MADALVSKTSVFTDVRVRLPPPALVSLNVPLDAADTTLASPDSILTQESPPL